MAARGRLRLLYAIFFLSGVAGLGYQMVWSRLFAVALGHEIASVLAVVSAFFAGLALGAWALDRKLSASRTPGLWYAGLELVIGLWGFVSLALIPALNDVALRLIGLEPSPWRHWSVAFAFPFVALLPATVAMGATLPAMERFVAPLFPDRRCVGGLYATNTFGAVVGSLAGAFVLVPQLGMRAAVVVLATVNLLCAAGAGALARRATGTADAASLAQAPAAAPPGTLEPAASGLAAVARWRIAVTVFCTGLLGIGYEVLALRVTTQLLQNTVYTFSAALAVYLLGTSAGAALYQRLARGVAFQPLLGYLLVGISIACMLGMVALQHLLVLYRWSATLLGEGLLRAVGAEMLVATWVFALPTLFMGAAFSHLVQAARREQGGVGRAMALNTVGASLAPPLFGVVLLPAVGAKWALVVVALGYLPLLGRASRLGWLAAAAVVGMVYFLPAHLRLMTGEKGSYFIDYREGVMATVSVVKREDGHRNLRINNRFQQGGTASTVTERRQAHLPLLLHPSPRRVLFLGVGTGISVGGAADLSEVHVDAVELVPEVLDVLPHFAPESSSPEKHANVRLYAADARRFVRASPASYDVIIGELFQPACDGTGSLYTVEHFSAVRDRLAPAGLFCQWLPLYQLDEEMVRVISASFLEVFPHTRAYVLSTSVSLPILGLVGTLDEVRYPADWFEERVRNPAWRSVYRTSGFASAADLFGTYLASEEQLRAFAEGAPRNTDNFPVVIFGAPRFIYQRGTTSYGRLIALLDRFKARPDDVLDLAGDPQATAISSGLARIYAARDRYERALVAEAEGRSEEALAGMVESVLLSANYAEAYDSAILLAMKEMASHPAQARGFLERLAEAQPGRREAMNLLAATPAGAAPP